MPDSDLRRITAFLAAFARRAAERTADLPGAFAATYLAMRHTGPVPAGGGAEGCRSTSSGNRSPGSGAPTSRPSATMSSGTSSSAARPVCAALPRCASSPRRHPGDAAAWADLYLDPAAGVAQIEDLVTDRAHRRRGHAAAVLGTALRQAADAGCTTRLLTADAVDWPRHWYARRGFTTVGRLHAYSRC